MTTACPNSTASGCRCPQHDPGLLEFAAPERRPALAAALDLMAEPVTLRVVTAGPDARDAGAGQRLDRMLAEARAACPACKGDARRCNDGNGAPRFGRLHGCLAWTADGDLAARRAQPAPSQPWEPRASRRVAA